MTVTYSWLCIYPSKRCTADKKAKHFSHQCTSVSISKGEVHYRVHSGPGLLLSVAEISINFHLHTLLDSRLPIQITQISQKAVRWQYFTLLSEVFVSHPHILKSTFLLILCISETVTSLSLVPHSYTSYYSFIKIMTKETKRLPEVLGNDSILLNTILELLSAFFGFENLIYFSGNTDLYFK